MDERCFSTHLMRDFDWSHLLSENLAQLLNVFVDAVARSQREPANEHHVCRVTSRDCSELLHSRAAGAVWLATFLVVLVHVEATKPELVARTLHDGELEETQLVFRTQSLKRQDFHRHLDTTTQNVLNGS